MKKQLLMIAMLLCFGPEVFAAGPAPLPLTPFPPRSLAMALASAAGQQGWSGGSGGGGTGNISGSGDANTVAKFTGTKVIGDSGWTDDGITTSYAGANGVSAGTFASTGGGALVFSGTEGTCTGLGAGQAVLCLDDSTTHTAQLSVNGEPFGAVSTGGFQAVFDGGGQPLVAATAYTDVAYTCVISDITIMVDQGTPTFTVWRVATGGTAIPVVGNSISTSGISISSGTLKQSTTVTDFTSTQLTAKDSLAVHIAPAGGVTWASYHVGCRK